MRKRKSLYQHEMRTMKWFLLAGIIAAVFFAAVLNSCLQMETLDTGFSMWEKGATFSERLCLLLNKASLILLPALAIMTVMQFGESHRKKTEEYFHSLPFTKRERFIVKATVGYSILTITMLVATVGAYIVRSMHISYIYKAAALTQYYKVVLGNETITHMLRSMVLFWLILLAVYSIMIFVHTIVSKGILASIIGIGIAGAPLWFWAVVSEILGAIVTKDGTRRQWGSVQHYFGIFAGMANGTAWDYPYEQSDTSWTTFVYYDNFWILMSICVFVIILCLLVAIYATGKTDMARGGQIVQKRPARIFLGTGIGLCFGTGIAWFCSYWFENEFRLNIFIIVGGLLSALICILCQKLFGRIAR